MISKNINQLILFKAFVFSIFILAVVLLPFLISPQLNPDYLSYKDLYEQKGSYLAQQNTSILYLALSDWHFKNFNNYSNFRLVVNLFTSFITLISILILIKDKKNYLIIIGWIFFIVFVTRNTILLRESLAFSIGLLGMIFILRGKPSLLSNLAGSFLILISSLFHILGIILIVMAFYRYLYKIIPIFLTYILIFFFVGGLTYLFQDAISYTSLLFDRFATEPGWSLQSLIYYLFNSLIFLTHFFILQNNSNIFKSEINWHYSINIAMIYTPLVIIFFFRTFEVPNFLLVSFVRVFDAGIHYILILLIYNLNHRSMLSNIYVFLVSFHLALNTFRLFYETL